jgi:hypothetical protein
MRAGIAPGAARRVRLLHIVDLVSVERGSRAAMMRRLEAWYVSS